MDWRYYSPLLTQSAGDETELSPLADINFPNDPSLYAPSHSHCPSDSFLGPLLSPPLPAFDPPSWPAVTSPPSPTASTASDSSSSSSSSSSFPSASSSHPSTPSTTLHAQSTPRQPATATPTSTPAVLPATLAVSPDLLRKLHRPESEVDTTTPATTTTRQPRKRVAGLTAQQRAELKRQKHREIDANRIQREKAAVKRLTALTTAEQQQRHIKDEKKEEDDEGEVEEGRRDKVTVLEDSARKIDELQQLVSRLTDACNVQQAHNRSLVIQLQRAIHQPPPRPTSPCSSSTASSVASSASSHPLSLLSSSVSQQLDAHIGASSLHSSWFVSSSVCIAAIRCATGCVLDVNQRFEVESNWQRSHVIGRLMLPPYEFIVGHSTTTKQSLANLNPQRFLVDGPDGRLVPSRTQPQYTRSKALIHELYKGEKQNIFCVFRYQMRDGRVYEVKSAAWTTSWVDESCDSGGSVAERRRPESMFIVCSYADAVCVDDGGPLSD